MADRGQVNFTITARDAASKQIRGIDRSLGGLSKTSVAVGAAVGTFVGNVAVKAFDAFAGSVGDAFAELIESDKLLRRTESVLRSTGNAAGVSAQHIEDFAESLESVTGVSAESIRNSENVLLTFTNIRNAAGKGNDVFDQTTRLALDMSTALGTDLQGSALQLGKALQDPAKGLTALRRAGVSFTASQVKTIKRLQESGDLLGAQRLILREVSKEFGGAGKAAGESFSGQMAILQDTLQDMIKDALRPILPLLMDFGKAVKKDVVPAFGRFIELITRVASVVGPRLRATFERIVPRIVEFAKALSERLVPFLSDLVEFVTRRVVPAVIAFVSKLSTGLRPTISAVAGFVVNLLLPALSRIVTSVQQNVLPIVGRLADFFVTRVVPAINSLVQFLVVNLAPVLDQVVGLIADQWLPTWARVAGFFTDTVLPVIANLVGALWGDGSGPLALALKSVAIAVGVVVTAVSLMVAGFNLAIDVIAKVAKAIGDSPIGAIMGALGNLFGGGSPTLKLQTVPAAASPGRSASTATLNSNTTVNVQLDGRTLGSAVSRYVGAAALADGGSRISGAR